MTRSSLSAALVLFLGLGAIAANAQPQGPAFAVSFPAARSASPLDGRIILLLATDSSSEPRAQVDADDALKTPFIFGLTVDGLKPGQSAILDSSAFGWPAASLASLKAGDYIVQAVLNRYETFRRADGSVVKLPPYKGEGQDWAKKPGNLYSKPVKIHLDPAHPQRIAIVLDQEIAPVAAKTVADYWREHYDLAHIIQRDWATLGPKLAGKIHIYVGSADTYYLNNAVYYAQATLESLKNPAYGGEVDYGDRAEHCWNGDHKLPNAYSRLHYDTFYLPKILARIQATAPKGADLTSWRY